MSALTVGSLFSGIGGLDLGLERAGMRMAWQCEIDPYARRVLARHWPDVKHWEDVADVNAGTVDVVCGGFPCQDVSVAGRREGLAGERSGLWWQFHRILGNLRPAWCIIENVPGLLSSNDGRDMGSILGALGDLGYGFAFRVLDAQFFGVAQRRRRVFIVGSLGGQCSAEVLLEPEGVPGDPPTCREAETRVAALTADGVGTCGADDNQAQAGHLIPDVISPLTAHEGRNDDNQVGGGQFIVTEHVRRLTPVECERLQGFPDGWTDDLSDMQRYRCLGNAVAVPVAEWIGRRIVGAELRIGETV